MKTLHMILVSSLLASSVQPRVKAGIDDDGIFAAIGIGAAAVATAVGGAFFVNWLLTPTDEQLIANTQSELLNYRNNLHNLVIDLSSNSHTNQIAVAYSLQRIIDTAGGSDISQLSSRIDQAIKNFDYAQRELSKRMVKLNTQGNNQHLKIMQMDALKTELHMIQPSLLYVQRFIQDHKAYFELGTVLNKVHKNFSHEYSMAYYDHPLSMDALRKSSLFARNYKYVIHAYLDDMKSIHSQIQRAGSHIRPEWVPAYGTIYAIYQRLNVYFAAIISEVQTSDLFRQEKYFKAQQELLERQLEIEREMARIAQAKLDAIRQQNHLLQKQNEQKERELKAQRDQLIIQLNSLNYDKPNTTIHINL